ncbi:MAG: dihydroneopterin aldolase [Bacteroidota bacterium]
MSIQTAAHTRTDKWQQSFDQRTFYDMGLISLENMRFFAYHGVYPEEQLTGNNFVIDIYIETSLEAAAMTDDVYETINYETVFLICKSVMRKPVKLIERLGFQIIHDLKRQFNSIQEVRIKITKETPIVGERMGSAAIELTDSFVSSCPRCGSPFICYSDENCQCQNLQLHPNTQKMLRQKYRGCLCGNCLAYYAQ